jgi:4a-hydroxytetrahydrobiopterin dehydratase
MSTLSEEDVRSSLADLPGWALGDDEIWKEYRFANFVDAVAFVERLVGPAEAANHHPDLDIRYNRVRVALSTHSEGGITRKDLALARELESIIAPGAGR